MRKISLRPQAYWAMIRYYWWRLTAKPLAPECTHEKCSRTKANPSAICLYHTCMTIDGKPSPMTPRKLGLEWW